jgi:hypothetical protein
MKILRVVVLDLFLLLPFANRSYAEDWPPIDQKDLAMTSIKEQPGAPAVGLIREEIDDDMNNDRLVYERIKILTDAGREHANIEIPYEQNRCCWIKAALLARIRRAGPERAL